MKKTVAALVVSAFAASSAQALTVYDKDGTNVDFYGSLRLALSKEKANNELKTANPDFNSNTRLGNDGSRFGVKLKHDLGNDLYALGRLELRFKPTGNDDFGDVYAKRAFVGLGTKSGHQIAFGRQVTIGDEISQAGFDYRYEAKITPLTTDGKSVVRYDYTGIDGLQLGANYNFSEGNEKDNLKNGYGLGAIYNFTTAAGREAVLAAGYTRDNFNTLSTAKHHKDAYLLSGSYKVNKLLFAADVGTTVEKNAGERETKRGFTLGVKYQVMPTSSIYTSYTGINTKNKDTAGNTTKSYSSVILLGTDYLFSDNVKSYLEGRWSHEKERNNSNALSQRELVGAVGLRVYW